MAKSKDKEVREAVNAKYVSTWQDGYRQGTKEAFEWCIRAAMEMNEKATSQDGKLATKFMARMMRKEIDNRQPPPPENGESVAPSPT
jgi:predicted secreted protein